MGGVVDGAEFDVGDVGGFGAGAGEDDGGVVAYGEDAVVVGGFGIGCDGGLGEDCMSGGAEWKCVDD